eukprot:XP_019922181.1 PREDICTED: uncharacterized protein LOC109618577 [Crassostrea gigas]
MAAEDGRETAGRETTGRETAGRETAGDGKAKLEEGREEVIKTGTGGNEGTLSGTVAGAARETGGPSGGGRLDGRLRDSQCLTDSSTDNTTISSSSMAVLSLIWRYELTGGSGPSATRILCSRYHFPCFTNLFL